MSDTPRTDEEVVTPAGHEGFYAGHERSYVWSEFARQLERELSAATAELAATKAELAKEKEDFWKAVANVGPCGACAEIIACGWTMHEHDGCAHAQLAQAKEQLRVAREALEEIAGLPNKELWFDSRDDSADYMVYKAQNALEAFTQPNLSADSLGGGNPAKGEGGVPSTFPA